MIKGQLSFYIKAVFICIGMNLIDAVNGSEECMYWYRTVLE